MRPDDLAVLRGALAAATADVWNALRNELPGERFYAFGLYTAPLVECVLPTANTEEGLRRKAAEYVARRPGWDLELR